MSKGPIQTIQSIIASTASVAVRHGFYKHMEKFFICGSLLIIALSFIVRITLYIKCRSLWLDEALLAESIVGRGWRELLTPPLSNGQSAPLLYVIAVKAIGSVLGYSEFSVRVFSLLSAAGLLICEAVLLKKAFNLSTYKIASIAVITALLPAYIWYSNELKPYMSDAFFVISAILLYVFYQQKKLNLPILTASYIILMGFSTPTVFFIGGALLCEFISAVKAKQGKTAILVSVSGAIIAAVFALYYLWWMAPVVGTMNEYWNNPKTFKVIMEDIWNIFTPFNMLHTKNLWLFVPFALLGIYYLIKSKNKTSVAVALGAGLLLFALLIGKWPLTARLWLFLPAIVLIFFPAGFDFIAKRYKILGEAGFYILSGIIACQLTADCFRYNMFIPGQEVNPLISYVRENIKEGEKLYVYPPAQYTLRFKNGYNTAKIGNVTADNIIYGKDKTEWSENKLGNELQSILQNNKGVYLLFQHFHTGLEGGLRVLQRFGKLTVIMQVQDTPLLYFQKTHQTWRIPAPPPPDNARPQ